MQAVTTSRFFKDTSLNATQSSPQDLAPRLPDDIYPLILKELLKLLIPFHLSTPLHLHYISSVSKEWNKHWNQSYNVLIREVRWEEIAFSCEQLVRFWVNNPSLSQVLKPIAKQLVEDAAKDPAVKNGKLIPEGNSYYQATAPLNRRLIFLNLLVLLAADDIKMFKNQILHFTKCLHATIDNLSEEKATEIEKDALRRSIGITLSIAESGLGNLKAELERQPQVPWPVYINLSGSEVKVGLFLVKFNLNKLKSF
jgi:hypothetical protein